MPLTDPRAAGHTLGMSQVAYVSGAAFTSYFWLASNCVS